MEPPAAQPPAPLPGIVGEALELLRGELAKPEPDVARASIVLGLLQDALLLDPHGQAGEQPPGALAAAVDEHAARFVSELVAPAAAKVPAKAKTAADKVVALAKFLRGKLAKAPAHKQPLHTQFLPSALRTGGKRQLDCLGIATAVFCIARGAAALHGDVHADLAGCGLALSDDHAWLTLPPAGAPCGGRGGAPSNEPGQQQQEQGEALVHVEVTDPRVFQRWGMLDEEDELEALEALARAAAAAPRGGRAAALAALASAAAAPAAALASQARYAAAAEAAPGGGGAGGSWLWHPASCAAFGWLNRLESALCGGGDDLLAKALLLAHEPGGGAEPCAQPGGHRQETQQLLPQEQQHGQPGQQPQQEQLGQQEQPGEAPADAAATWLRVAAFLWAQATGALPAAAAVLRRYPGAAGKPDRSANSQLLEAVRDLLHNLADGAQALAWLTSLQAHLRELPAPAAAPLAAGAAARDAAQASPGAGQQEGASAPAAAQEPGRGVTDAAAAAAAGGGPAPQLAVRGVLGAAESLTPLLGLFDAVLEFFGPDSADVPGEAVAHFLAAAGAFTPEARAGAATAAAASGALRSARVAALGAAGSGTAAAWRDLAPGLEQQPRGRRPPPTRARTSRHAFPPATMNKALFVVAFLALGAVAAQAHGGEWSKNKTDHGSKDWWGKGKSGCNVWRKSIVYANAAGEVSIDQIASCLATFNSVESLSSNGYVALINNATGFYANVSSSNTHWKTWGKGYIVVGYNATTKATATANATTVIGEVTVKLGGYKWGKGASAAAATEGFSYYDDADEWYVTVPANGSIATVTIDALNAAAAGKTKKHWGGKDKYTPSPKPKLDSFNTAEVLGWKYVPSISVSADALVLNFTTAGSKKWHKFYKKSLVTIEFNATTNGTTVDGYAFVKVTGLACPARRG
ncbi:hypothetical protein HT031_001674 [Scenedesmus sp. PABB004]|nr:hypothetical protein HT031_001674 [Scenedesmus sp. PABB004]